MRCFTRYKALPIALLVRLITLHRKTLTSWFAITNALVLVIFWCPWAYCLDDGHDFFERSVRPIFLDKCIECHGDENPESGLRLTSKSNLLRGGDSGPAVVEKSPESSLLINAVRQQGTLKMPPDGKLSLAEIDALNKWIEIGAPWPESNGAIRKAKGDFKITETDRQHWSFLPVTDPAIPTVTDPDWCQTSIDQFVLAKIESVGCTPYEQADRRTLLRRVYFDLIGLPPTWREVDEFVNSPLPTAEAFKNVVEHLLASPRYGEHWGRHWLDVARFADTKDGVLMYGDDRIRPYAYTYRDYVSRAFTEDLPFDQFVCDQIAADLVEPKVEPWRLAGMGFLTLGRMFDNNIHDVIDDQIDTVSRGFLGLTVACSRCHDHKYDPVSTADYYSMYGVFASSETPFEFPTIATDSSPEAAEFEKQYTAKRDELNKLREEQFTFLTNTARQRIGDYLVHVATTKPDPLESAIFFLSLTPEDLRPQIVARWRLFLDQPAMADDAVFGAWYQMIYGRDRNLPLDDIRIAELKDHWNKLPIGTKPQQINPIIREALMKSDFKSRPDFARVHATVFSQVYEQYKNASAASGTASPVVLDEFQQQLIDIVTSRDSPLYFPKSHTRQYMSRAQKDEFGGKLQEMDRMAVKSPQATPRAMTLCDAETVYEPRIFVRGNPSQLGRYVSRQFIDVISSPDREPFVRGSGRLELARAIADPKNPLTARVFVNRVWMHHFGEPLVATPSDFGNRSQPPADAALLDHLASQFIKGGWSIKHLHRLILQSAAWQQSTMHAANEPAIDAFFPHRQRLSMESMRDTLLAVSGRLEHRDGGKPSDISDPQNRFRTIYGLVDRQSLPGMFRAFDFASPDQSVERRSRTMVPQQTLFALNSPFVIEQAKSLVARAEISQSSDPAARISALFETVLQRQASENENAACLAYLNNASQPETALSAWEQLAQILLCSNELMYVD
jgi:Protein of unknown function (DUF1549)/Protein of unknown function (DUF1553)/Planctomycete cytochrome C